MSAWTFEPLWAESGEVERTCYTSNVFLGTKRAFGTKASVVPGAFPPLDGRVNVQVKAIITAVAEAESGIEPALGDPPHVVFVQIVALVVLLAQASKPVLAHRAFVRISQRRRSCGQEVEMAWPDMPPGA